MKTAGQPPSGPEDVLDERVIYIGETGGSLKSRWDKFDGSAFRDKDGHSGGKNYRDSFGDDGHDLYVAATEINATTVELDLRELVGDTYRLFVERKLLLDYVLKHGRLPKCNKE